MYLASTQAVHNVMCGYELELSHFYFSFHWQLHWLWLWIAAACSHSFDNFITSYIAFRGVIHLHLQHKIVPTGEMKLKNITREDISMPPVWKCFQMNFILHDIVYTREKCWISEMYFNGIPFACHTCENFFFTIDRRICLFSCMV